MDRNSLEAGAIKRQVIGQEGNRKIKELGRKPDLNRGPTMCLETCYMCFIIHSRILMTL
jgi:hypothetical protein